MYCPKCGHKNDEDALYCDKCGENLKEAKHFKDKDRFGRWWRSKTIINKIIIIGFCFIGLILLGYYVSILTEDPLTHLDIYNVTVQTPGNVILEIDANTTGYIASGESAKDAVVTVSSINSEGNESIKLDSKNQFTYKISIPQDDIVKSVKFTAEKKGKDTSYINLILVRSSQSSNSNGENKAIELVKNYNSKITNIGRAYDAAYTYESEISSTYIEGGEWSAKTLINDNYLVMFNYENHNGKRQSIFKVDLKTGQITPLNDDAKKVYDAINNNETSIFKQGY